MRACLSKLSILFCWVSSLSAQSVLLSPTTNQTITQPTGTFFSIGNGSSATVAKFGNFGITYTSVLTNSSVALSLLSSSFTLDATSMKCFQQGYDLGNNGTSATGWSACSVYSTDFTSSVRGISQLNGGRFTHFGQGDTAASYLYLTAFGGTVAASDEGVEHTVLQNHQICYTSGNLATGSTTGSNLVSVSSLGCSGYEQSVANINYLTFSDGGILLDTRSALATTATISGFGIAMNGMYYTLASGTVTTSKAWGNIIPSSCTNNGNGQNQVYTSTTCNITLGTSPASPGNFAAGSDIFLSGPFEEEAAVTSVGANIGGVQSVTFNTRYAWDNANGNTNAALVMQGDVGGTSFPGGLSFVATASTSSWPVAYAVVGATSPTQVFFSNCVVGSCNGHLSSGNIIPTPPTPCCALPLTRAGNIVTSHSNGNIYSYPILSSITVAGYTPADLNGTFTVTNNSYDALNPVVQWAQTGVDETSTGAYGTITKANPGITFYPSAFITGVNGGTTNTYAQLATNAVPFASGDPLVGAPSSEFEATGLVVVQGQWTPVDGSVKSSAITVVDDGPSPMSYAFFTRNNASLGEAGVATGAISLNGSYGNDLYMSYRPANNGAILYVQGGEPVSPTAKPYKIFEDNGSPGGTISYNPTTAFFSFYGGSIPGGLTAPTITATGSASAFAANTTVGGSVVCTKVGNCQLAGTTSSIGGSALAAGTCASGTATVTGATAGHTVGVSASDGTLPNPLIVLSASVTAVNTITVQECAISAVTPTAKTYNVTTY